MEKVNGGRSASVPSLHSEPTVMQFPIFKLIGLPQLSELHLPYKITYREGNCETTHPRWQPECNYWMRNFGMVAISFMVFDIAEWVFITKYFLIRQCRNPMGRLDLINRIVADDLIMFGLYLVTMGMCGFMVTLLREPFRYPNTRIWMEDKGYELGEDQVDTVSDGLETRTTRGIGLNFSHYILNDICMNDPYDWYD